ncbi:unnamed protein product [Ectocarpus fasciculatus]
MRRNSAENNTGDGGGGADGDACSRRDRRPNPRATLLRALAVLLLFNNGSQGLVHSPAPAHGCSRRRLHIATAGGSYLLRVPGLASRKRFRERERGLLRRFGSSRNGVGEDTTGTGREDAAPCADVHTLLIDNYDSYTYNLFQLLAVVNGRPPFVVFNDDDDGDLWKTIERMGRVPDNIVISPGPGRPDVPKDFGMCAQALREAIDIPILGVCLGHEGLGLEHGATVARAPEPMHGRLSPVFHDGQDALFRGVPQGSRVVRYHSLVVDGDTLPAEGPLRATAWTGDGVLMAMRHEQRPHWGVQFHPESVGTRHGSDIVRNFRDLTVAWHGGRGAAAAVANGGCVGIGGGIASPTESVRLQTDLPSGMVRNGYGKPRAEVEMAAGASPALFPRGSAETAADAVTPVVADTTAAASVPLPDRRSRPAPRRRKPFVLLVEEVDMAGDALNDGDEGRGPGDSRRRSGPTMPDTEHAFRALYGDDRTAWWLDSSSQRPGLAVDGQAKARFTFMGGADGPLSQTIECYGGGRLVIQHAGVEDDAVGAEKGGNRQEVRGNIMDYLKAEMAKMGHAISPEGASDDSGGLEVRMVGNGGGSSSGIPGVGDVDDEGRARNDEDGRGTLPFDFVGGFVGFLGYELRHEATDVMRRSAGGTEWDWQPPGGGKWEDSAFGGSAAVHSDHGSSNPGASASTAVPVGSGEDHAGVNGSAGPRHGGGGGDVPLGFLVFVDRFVAFDHQQGKAYVLALSRAETSPNDDDDGGSIDVAVSDDRRGNDAQASAPTTTHPARDGALDWIRRTAASLRGLAPSRGGVSEGHAAAGTSPAALNGAADKVGTACAMDVHRSRYEQSLEEVMRLVGEGETYEVCLTNQIVCERPKGPGAVATPPLDLYSRLRRSNPAPYAAYIVHDPNRRLSSPAAGGDAGAGGAAGRGGGGGDGPAFAVCCSSPEKFLKVDGDGWVESKPIKGTVKRGKTPAEDLILATDLAKGEKNMAENLMIVDLVRNDLGRVCQTGSVSVPKLMHVESYATVHQLVSTIRGRLRPDCGALDAIAAAFPGGSMTGAPKRRTMEIIDRLEQGRPRGVYSGSIGFLGVDGAADFNIVIRTAVVTPQNVTVGAGGAVIALSEVDDEYEEMLLKATSVLGALGHKKHPGRGGPAGSEPTRSATTRSSPSSESKKKRVPVTRRK